MKILTTLCLLLLPATSMASDSGQLSCKFDKGHEVNGILTEQGRLQVDSFTIYNGDFIDLNNEDNLESLNENPIRSKSSRAGRLKFTLDSIDDDPDYGDICDLYLPSNLKKGLMAANYSCKTYSRGLAGSSYVTGSCILK